MSGSDGVEIGPARVLDAGRLGELMSNSIARLGWMPQLHSRAEDIHFVGQMIDAGWVRVARMDGWPLGFLALSDDEVHALYLQPELQGKGIARALVEDAKTGRDHLALWCIELNARAVRFYRKAGFVETRRTDGAANDAGLPDIRFEWTRKAD